MVQKKKKKLRKKPRKKCRKLFRKKCVITISLSLFFPFSFISPSKHRCASIDWNVKRKIIIECFLFSRSFSIVEIIQKTSFLRNVHSFRAGSTNVISARAHTQRTTQRRQFAPKLLSLHFPFVRRFHWRPVINFGCCCLYVFFVFFFRQSRDKALNRVVGRPTQKGMRRQASNAHSRRTECYRNLTNNIIKSDRLFMSWIITSFLFNYCICILCALHVFMKFKIFIVRQPCSRWTKETRPRCPVIMDFHASNKKWPVVYTIFSLSRTGFHFVCGQTVATAFFSLHSSFGPFFHFGHIGWPTEQFTSESS